MSRHPLARHAQHSQNAQRGLTMVELLIGMAIGLFIVAAAASLMTGNLRENRNLMIESRLMQDLRTAADLITRDLRRAGYWAAANAGVRGDAGGAALANPYTDVTPAGAPADSTSFRFSRDATENNTVDSNEQFAFRLRNGAIELQLGAGNWQALTDATTLTVTEFSVTPTTEEISLADFCAQPCAAGSATCPPAPAGAQPGGRRRRPGDGRCPGGAQRAQPGAAAQRPDRRRLPGLTAMRTFHSPKAQRGAAALVVIVMVLLVSAMLLFIAASCEPRPDLRATLFRQPIACEPRALAAAESGLDWAVARLNRPSARSTLECLAVAATPRRRPSVRATCQRAKAAASRPQSLPAPAATARRIGARLAHALWAGQHSTLKAMRGDVQHRTFARRCRR